MANLRALTICLLIFKSGFAQNRIPPPPCYANDNTGAGGVVGNGYFLKGYSEDFINFSFHLQQEGGDFNDVLVIYIATESPGRNIIDQTVDDANDPYRTAITNSNAYGFGSTITFPAGFEASYAIAIDANSGGLYSIPNSGNVGNGELNYITSVNSTLSSNTQQFFDINFIPLDIGLANAEEFYFVAIYVGHNGYTYDEGYGDGILDGTQGTDDVTFTTCRAINTIQPGCSTVTLNNHENNKNDIGATYVNNILSINGINDEVTIRLYDLMGRGVLNFRKQINGSAKIPMDLLKNQLQFIVIESSNKRKVLKVIPTSH
jgi:hypothetical protein